MIFWTLPIIRPMFTNAPPISPLASEERNRGNMNHTCLKFVAAGLLTCLAGGCAWLDPPCDNGCADNGPNGQWSSCAGGGGAGGGAGAADNPDRRRRLSLLYQSRPARLLLQTDRHRSLRTWGAVACGSQESTDASTAWDVRRAKQHALQGRGEPMRRADRPSLDCDTSLGGRRAVVKRFRIYNRDSTPADSRKGFARNIETGARRRRGGIAPRTSAPAAEHRDILRPPEGRRGGAHLILCAVSNDANRRGTTRFASF